MKSNSDAAVLQKNWRAIMETMRDNLALMLLVLHDEYGFGQERIGHILNSMVEYAEQFDEWLADDVLNEKREQLTGRLLAEDKVNEFLRLRLLGIVPDEWYDELLCTAAPSNHNMRAKFKRNTQVQRAKPSMTEAAEIQKRVAAMKDFLGGSKNA